MTLKINKGQKIPSSTPNNIVNVLSSSLFFNRYILKPDLDFIL